MADIGYSWSTFDAVTREIVRLIQPAKILDIGAGGGKYGRLLKPIVPKCALTALEYDAAAVPTLRAAGYDFILTQPADALYDSPAEAYDMIILGDVIEHMRHSEGRDLLEFLNYRARYLLISTPECMPMSLPDFYAGHNSMWRPDAFSWHDYWAHQQCASMHFYLLRGHLDWKAPELRAIVDAVNHSEVLNDLPDDQTTPAQLVIRDTRYVRAAEGTTGYLYRPS